jgi:NitT/TauT family transport system substrate-binding protein
MRGWVSLLVCVLSIFGLLFDTTAQSQEARKIKAAYTAIAGAMAPLWAAQDGGIFKRYGLDVNIIATPSGQEGMNALIAGELNFLQIAGSTTTAAAVAGADVVVLATTTGVLPLSLVVGPGIQKAEDLKGKSVGISRFGTSFDTAARLALRHFGLEPIKDTAIVQIGESASILAAMRGNRIQAGILGYPFVTEARREGLRILLDIASLDIPYAHTGITTRRALLQQDRKLATSYVKAQVEAIARLKKDKAFALQVLGKYLRTEDKDVLEETYDVFTLKFTKKTPLPTMEAFQSVLEELAQQNPKAKGQDPRKFYDDSIVRELDKSGFIDALYR